ncbi:hypothetical protein ACFQFH_14365 [Halobaculum halobium]|uniref:SMC hinge domain-containing protein n=1 Tax=Halobaculum halobium TaxID=3032281 RepID=A0ABD5TIS2_9EURY|nr:hypothetical protein [Halobaculum sp. SYNS20]
MTRELVDRLDPPTSEVIRRAAAEGDVARVCAALGLDPEDPLATLTNRPPSLWHALAAAARGRGRDHRADDDRERLRSELDAVSATLDAAGDASEALASARRRAAAADSDVERLRERAATLRGRLTQAREGTGPTSADLGRSGDPADSADPDGDAATVESLRDDFAAATRALTEAETERVAAEQALARATERSRSVRDARERRLRLRDALANRRREARRDLARAVYPAFSDAISAFRSDVAGHAGDPVSGGIGDGPGEFEGDAVVAHAAAVRIARRSDPVVVAADCFPGREVAREWLGSPVVFVGSD